MRNKTAIEKGNKFHDDIQNGLIFGRITKVYPEERMCEVKTFGSGPLADQNIPKCQWISADANPEGDESSAIPRINSYGIVAFIDGEPFILGFFRPLNEAGTANVGGDQEEINEGDKILKTVGKNKIIMRSSGEIQIESTRTCRTIYFPERHLLNHLCRNYEFRTDGGTIDWIHIDENKETQDTVQRIEIRDNINRKNIVLQETGTIARDNPLIFRRRIGQGVNGDEIQAVVHTTEVKNTGETDIFIRKADATNGYKLNIKPSGETTLNIADRMTASVKPTGETTIVVGGKTTLTLKPDGTLDINTTKLVNVKSPKIHLNGDKSGITTANSHDNVIDYICGVPVKPSTTVFSDV